MCESSYIDGFEQDCNISIANALEILQSCTKPSRECFGHYTYMKNMSDNNYNTLETGLELAPWLTPFSQYVINT